MWATLSSVQKGRLFIVFVALSALAWVLFVPFYALLFSWTEYASGINWIYLPHGLRMMLVLLFGIPGAIGFSIGAQILSVTGLDGIHVNTWALSPVAFVPGLAAYLAAWLTIKNWPGKELVPTFSHGLSFIDGRRLVLLAFVSAILNSAGHVAVRAIFGQAQRPFDIDFLMMFMGDFFGALLLLYLLRWAIIFFEARKSRMELR